MLDGRIMKGIGGFYYVDTDKGLYECRARGIFRKNKQIPLVGDRVKISVVEEEKKIATGYIGNALRSSAADHVTTFADEIFDYEKYTEPNWLLDVVEEKVDQPIQTSKFIL